MDKILAEQNFSNSDRANPNSAAKLGKLLGVDAIIVGSITQFGNDTKNTGIGGAGGALGGFGLGDSIDKKTKAVVTVASARLVNIDTAEILGVAEGHGESFAREHIANRRRRKLARVRRGRGGFRQQRLPANYHWRSRQGGHRADEHRIDRGDTKLEARVINVSGLVAAVDGGQIVLNVGGRAGLKVGDQLSVERVTREIKDPSTGAVIRRLATPVGTIRVTDVDDISSVAAPVSGAGFKVGDSVKTVTQ